MNDRSVNRICAMVWVSSLAAIALEFLVILWLG
jgi:hypothetical protein